jgi:hypothetical protein
LSNHELIASLIDAGHTLDQIEVDLDRRAPWLDDDERAALWLFAWAYESSPRGRRKEAERAAS